MSIDHKKQVTISDVARRAQVTPAVVSRVLNHDPTLRVREETSQAVVRAARDLEYTPNRLARALRLSTSGALGLMVHDLGNPLHAETVRGAQSSAAAHGYVLLLADAEELAVNEAAYEELLTSRRIDGALLHLGGQLADEPLSRLTHQRPPTVVINSQVSTAAGSVTLQDEAAAVLATEHLLDLGHTRIGFLRALSQSPQGSRRLSGVKGTLDRAGFELQAQWTPEAGFDVVGGALAMQRLLEGAARPTAVVVANVMAAIGALDSARKAGVRVPEDMSLVAIHDTWIANHTAPPLTTVRLPLYQLGEVAVDLLVEVLDEDKRRDVVLSDPPPQLICRASSAHVGFNR